MEGEGNRTEWQYRQAIRRVGAGREELRVGSPIEKSAGDCRTRIKSTGVMSNDYFRSHTTPCRATPRHAAPRQDLPQPMSRRLKKWRAIATAQMRPTAIRVGMRLAPHDGRRKRSHSKVITTTTHAPGTSQPAPSRLTSPHPTPPHPTPPHLTSPHLQSSLHSSELGTREQDEPERGEL